MFSRPTPPPTGPRNSSPARRGISRGGIQKRRTCSPRVDKDGDLVMDPVRIDATSGRDGNRPEGTRNSRGGASGRAGRTSGAIRGNTSTRQARQAIIKGLGSEQANILESRVSRGVLTGPGRAPMNAGRHNSSLSPKFLRIRGLKESKVAANSDGGLSDLLGFLERKANGLDTQHRKGARIHKVCSIVRITGYPEVMQYRLNQRFIPKPN
jgi:nuclear RNA export factor